MTLTEEQFNKLVTRDEREKLEKKVDEVNDNVKKILYLAEGDTTSHKKIE